MALADTWTATTSEPEQTARACLDSANQASGLAELLDGRECRVSRDGLNVFVEAACIGGNFPFAGNTGNTGNIPSGSHDRLNRRWLRGGFPEAWLARSNPSAFRWLESFARTFLERDLPALGIRVPGPALRRFWTMLAHWHGQVWNSTEFARSFGVADATVRRYLDILTSALVVRQLQPRHANIAKRQIKAPKVYLRDAGVLHALLGIDSMQSLNAHPKSGASWEGFLLEVIIDRLRLEDEYVHFWAAHTGAELDLMITRGGSRIGVEIKRTTAPRVTPSIRAVLRDLGLAEVILVHAGGSPARSARTSARVAADRLYQDLGL